MPRYFELGNSTKILKRKIEFAKSDVEEFDRYNFPNIVREGDVKISFDLENVDAEYDTDRLTGYHTLDNGLSFLGLSCGGDWEYPVFWIIYWDGKELRGYVPTEGNYFNRITKEAYGNGDDKDLEDLRKRFPGENFESADEGMEHINSLGSQVDLIKKDIQNRIHPR
jgi:hypothetical protein